MSDLAIPEPDPRADLEGVRRFLVACARLRQIIREESDLRLAGQMRERLAALARFVGNRQGKKEVLAEERRTEVLIGQLLGPLPGHGPGRGKEKIEPDQCFSLDPADVNRFRTLAEHEALVELMIGQGKPERNAILAAIRDAERKRPGGRGQLVTGDFREVLDDLTDVDAVVTDPPYGAEFLPLFSELGTWAAKVLRPGGVLAVMSGQYHLPEVFALLGSGPLRYRWTLSYQVRGESTRSHPANLASMWKPVILYGGTDVALGSDVVTSARNDKAHHEWGQSESGMANLIERLTAPGWLVADPFMGAGTTGVAAVRLGREFIGCDLDPEHVETARRRLGIR